MAATAEIIPEGTSPKRAPARALRPATSREQEQFVTYLARAYTRGNIPALNDTELIALPVRGGVDGRNPRRDSKKLFIALYGPGPDRVEVCILQDDHADIAIAADTTGNRSWKLRTDGLEVHWQAGNLTVRTALTGAAETEVFRRRVGGGGHAADVRAYTTGEADVGWVGRGRGDVPADLRELLAACRPRTYVDLFTAIGFHLQHRQNRPGDAGSFGNACFTREDVFEAWERAKLPMPSNPDTAATRAGVLGFVERAGSRPAERPGMRSTPVYRVTRLGIAALRAGFPAPVEYRRAPLNLNA